MLGLFFNILPADEKYSLLNRGNLMQHFQMQFSQKQKMFSEFFFAFSEFRLNFEPLPYLLITVKAIQFEKVSIVICKILGLFLNPLTADNKYSLLNRANLLQHFQMELSKKRKTFCLFFSFAFSKFKFRFEYFQKTDHPHT